MKNAGSGSKGGTDVLPNAEDLKMSQTVQNHMNDVIKKAVEDKKWEPKSYYLWKKENNLAVPKSFKF